MDGKIVVDEKGTIYYSLTNIARNNTSGEQLGYVIQSWLRSYNTLEFLKAWEVDRNPSFDVDGYDALIRRMKQGNFTITPKQWIEQTNAAGIVSKQGKNGGTYADMFIVYEFFMWVSPQFKYTMLSILELVRQEGKIQGGVDLLKKFMGKDENSTLELQGQIEDGLQKTPVAEDAMTNKQKAEHLKMLAKVYKGMD